MKISNSKKQLAKIIHENGGWREGNFAIQDKDDRAVWFLFEMKGRPLGKPYWPGTKSRRITCHVLLPNWHQTVLSRDEYFDLHPVAEETAKEVPVPEAKPTIEQLAAGYREKQAVAKQAQEEADSHRCGAEAALAKLVAAGKELGLVLSVEVLAQEPELVIIDWWDLQVGDVIVVDYVDAPTCRKQALEGAESIIVSDGDEHPACATNENYPAGGSWWLGGPAETRWRFIRRPAKE